MGGNVVDYVGGVADLRAGILRAVGVPAARLDEDHLRALRAVRFSARLGLALEQQTALAIRDHASQLTGVSRERIGEELRRMFTAPQPGAPTQAIVLLEELHLDAPVLNEPHRTEPLGATAALPPRSPYSATLAAWLIDRHHLYTPIDPRPNLQPMVSRVRSALCLTNIERDELADILACFNDLMAGGGWFSRRVASQKRWAARSGFGHALACLAPHHPETASKVRELVKTLAIDGIGLAPTPLVDGEALIELGFKPGPVFKSLLERLYDEQLEGRLKTKAEGMELARVWGV
jgi:poly(A) polymerase